MLVLLGVSLSTARAAVVELIEKSDPEGLFAQTITPKDSATAVSTRTAPEIGGYWFSHWTVDGVRYDDSTGAGAYAATFTIYAQTEAVAHYVPTGRDTDADGLEDGYELHYYGSLDQTSDSDTDADGFKTGVEKFRGYHPRLADTLVEGGISRRRSATLTVMVNPIFVYLTETSDPTALHANSRVARKGEPVGLTTAASPSGYTLAGYFLTGAQGRRLAAGADHALYLRNDGALLAWGANADGQLGDGTTSARAVPQIPATGGPWLAVAAGNAFSVGLKADGTLWAWGRNDRGQLGDGTTQGRLAPVAVSMPDAKPFMAVAAGAAHGLAVRFDMTLWAWGANDHGQLGNGGTTDQLSPVQIGAVTDWRAIAAGGAHSLGVRADGSLWAWGDDTQGQCGLGAGGSVREPTRVGTETGWADVAAGARHSLALKTTGAVWAWGANDHGQLGTGRLRERLLYDNSAAASRLNVTYQRSGTDEFGDEINLTGSNEVLTKFLVEYYGTSLDASATARVNLYANDGPLVQGNVPTPGSLLFESDPFPLMNGINTVLFQDFELTVPRTVTWTLELDIPANGGEVGLLLYEPPSVGSSYDDYWEKRNGLWDLYRWPDQPTWGNFGAQAATTEYEPTEPLPREITGLTGVTQIAAGGDHSGALGAGGRLYGWGDNGDHQLGADTLTRWLTPQLMDGATAFEAVAAGAGTTLARLSDQSARGWGALGSGAVVDATAATPPSGFAGVRLDNPLSTATPSVVLTGPTTVTVRYIGGGRDQDSDGIDDGYELFLYNTLANGATSDTDGDGFALAVEKFRGYSPVLSDTLIEGGISRRRSSLVALNLVVKPVVRFASDPVGRVTATQQTVDVGTVVETPDYWGESDFTYWDVGGVVQRNAYGTSLGKVSLTVTADVVATAHFLAGGGDADGDGVPDVWEWRYLGSLEFNGSHDADGDGFTAAQEQFRGYHPRLPDTLIEGGISRRRSETLTLNLQGYERLVNVQVGGTLTRLFSFDPDLVTGTDFGPNASPAWCDWDGDGDADLFVASDTGLKVFENTGDKWAANLVDRSGDFTGLAGLVGGVTQAVLTAGDWNRDGKCDLAMGGNTATLRFIASPGYFGSGQPAAASFTLEVSGTPATTVSLPALGDLDGDGRPELLVWRDDGAVRWYRNTANDAQPFSVDQFNENVLGTTVPDAASVAIGDANYDDVADVLVADGTGQIWEFHQGNAVLTLRSKVWGGSARGYATRPRISLADWDGDGDCDLVGGTAAGAVFGLRDPHVGRPTGVAAKPGVDSIYVAWDADRQSRIRGYKVYRAATPGGSFAALDTGLVTAASRQDAGLALGSAYTYRATGFTETRLPGSSSPRLVESRASLSVTAQTRAALRILPLRGLPGTRVAVRVAIENSAGVSGQNLEIQVGYDPTRFTPAAQTAQGGATAKRGSLCKTLTTSDDGATANGVVRAVATSGEVSAGSGAMLAFEFQVASALSLGTTAAFTLPLVRVNGQDLVGLPGATFTAAADHFLGDVDGDGNLTAADRTSLEALVNDPSLERSPEVLMAADLNGDGDLGSDDIVLLQRLLDGLPLFE